MTCTISSLALRVVHRLLDNLSKYLHFVAVCCQREVGSSRFNCEKGLPRLHIGNCIVSADDLAFQWIWHNGVFRFFAHSVDYVNGIP